MNVTITKTSIAISEIADSNSINIINAACAVTKCKALNLGNTSAIVTGSFLGLFMEELEVTSTEVIHEQVHIRRGLPLQYA